MDKLTKYINEKLAIKVEKSIKKFSIELDSLSFFALMRAA
jgi:hypothetical protein